MSKKKYKVVAENVYESLWDDNGSWNDEEVLTTFPSKEEAMKYISELKLDYDVDGNELSIYGDKATDYITHYGRYIRYQDDDDNKLHIIISAKEMD